MSMGRTKAVFILFGSSDFALFNSKDKYRLTFFKYMLLIIFKLNKNNLTKGTLIEKEGNYEKKV